MIYLTNFKIQKIQQWEKKQNEQMNKWTNEQNEQKLNF
jgi:hypothetical protein